MRVPRILAVSLSFLLLGKAAGAADKLSERAQLALTASAPDRQLAVWVYFTDKGPKELLHSPIPRKVAQTLVSERALERRRNVLPESGLVDYSDLPVDGDYVDRVVSLASGLRQTVRWFNAVSVTATPGQIEQIAALPFVREVDVVMRYRRGGPEEPVVPLEHPGGAAKGTGTHTLPYGPSFTQVAQIGVPSLHDLGNSAQGVIIGHFDNGVILPEHESIAGLPILAQHDFVDHKESVKPLNPTSGAHGLITLSTLAGRKDGQLIGPAFGARFVLARTENDSSETPVEEDNWAAAIEWAESLGVQVTSTSLGYLDFDSGYISYSWQDMNGRTALITRAAAMAVRKGVVVVNSAGNEGFNAEHNTLIAPADADSVLAIGAVFSTGIRAGFSSVGPTTSIPPRIKPDVMAMGVGVVCADPSGVSRYGTANGTSLACPLAAGVAALLVRAYPHATPMQIVGAIKATASNAATPNNEYGWGIINAPAALAYLDRLTSPRTEAALVPNYPNPFNRSTTILYDLTEPGSVSVRVYDILGRTVRTLVGGVQQSPPALPVTWDGTNDAGMQVASGVYLCRLEFTGISGRAFTATTRMLLLR